MTIWVDADACPREIKEILYKAAARVCLPLILVANRSLQVPRSRFIQTVVVEAGADVADQEIVNRMAAGDLVVTADIPLAAAVIEKGGHALEPRGDFFSEENIGERLAVRNFMDDLRSGGVETGGPATFTKSDRARFANQLDRFLAGRR